mmetsp:Transcript_1037/g.1274  ORF Transcript_1037/g.1274 Transcript_1037/m.1274 type:complete len:209 (-) Transcript_1037:327-953(-)
MVSGLTVNATIVISELEWPMTPVLPASMCLLFNGAPLTKLPSATFNLPLQSAGCLPPDRSQPTMCPSALKPKPSLSSNHPTAPWRSHNRVDPDRATRTPASAMNVRRGLKATQSWGMLAETLRAALLLQTRPSSPRPRLWKRWARLWSCSNTLTPCADPPTTQALGERRARPWSHTKAPALRRQRRPLPHRSRTRLRSRRLPMPAALR